LRTFAFLINPAANRWKSDELHTRLRSEIEGRWPGSAIMLSRKPGHIAGLAKEAAGRYDAVVACGGDGTVREVASVLRHTDTLMGILPAGSGNDFRKSLGIPRDLEGALDILENGTPAEVDMGLCNEIPFVNTLGIGFDGMTNRLAAESGLLHGGLRYAWAALRANFMIKPWKARIWMGEQLQERQLLMLTAANGRVEGGSFTIAPDASVTDGLLDFILLRPVSRALLPILLPIVTQGMHRRLPQLEMWQTSRLELELEGPVMMHADGETVNPEGTRLTITCLPKALRILVPEPLK